MWLRMTPPIPDCMWTFIHYFHFFFFVQTQKSRVLSFASQLRAGFCWCILLVLFAVTCSGSHAKTHPPDSVLQKGQWGNMNWSEKGCWAPQYLKTKYHSESQHSLFKLWHYSDHGGVICLSSVTCLKQNFDHWVGTQESGFRIQFSKQRD
jgi:hypothetical protein